MGAGMGGMGGMGGFTGRMPNGATFKMSGNMGGGNVDPN